MSIPTGTLCYLTGDHGFAGRCCTVTGPLEYCLCAGPSGISQLNVYRIDVPSAPAVPSIGDYWVAQHYQLIPIAPPSPAIDVTQSKHAQRLRKMGAPA